MGVAVETVSESTDFKSLCSCHQAAKWAALSYEIAGENASVEPFFVNENLVETSGCQGWLVVVPGEGRVECVIDEDSDLRDAIPRIDEISESGWAVWALLPLARLSFAHEVLESHVERIQGWWDRGETFTFTSPEIP